MPTIRCIALILLLSCSLAMAKYTLFKSKAGMLIVWNKPGLYCLLDIPGKDLSTVGTAKEPNPKLIADDYFLQIIAGSISALEIPAESSDKDILIAQYIYETQFHNISPEDAPMEISTLSNGTPCIMWSMLPKESEYKHFYLCFRSADHVMTICAVNTVEPKAQAPFPFLRSIADTFYRSPNELKISWDDEGNYHYDK